MNIANEKLAAMATLKRSHVKELEAKKVQMEKLSIKLHQQLAAARADNLLLEQKVVVRWQR